MRRRIPTEKRATSYARFPTSSSAPLRHNDGTSAQAPFGTAFKQTSLPLASSDATSSGEAANLQSRLRTLSTGLAGLRNSLHESGGTCGGGAASDNLDTQPNYCNINGSPPPPLPHENAATEANCAVGVIAPITANPPVGFQVGEFCQNMFRAQSLMATLVSHANVYVHIRTLTLGASGPISNRRAT